MAGKELDASVIDPPKEVEESDLDNSRWYTWDDLARALARHFQYNVEIVPDRLSLTRIEKKPSESFREYGFRWREQAARVKPPMEEAEMMEYFPQALEPIYFGHLISAIDKSLNEVVKMGGMVEEGLKSSKIMSYSAIKATTQAIQNGTGCVLRKKKKEDVAMVASGSWPEYRNKRMHRKKTFTPLGESYTSLFQRLRQLDVLRPIESKLQNPSPKNLDYSLICAYCSDALGHDTKKCWHLKNAIQELIDTNQIVVQSPKTPNINQNPLPAHAEMHMIEIVYKDGEPEKPLKSVMMIRSSDSNLVKTLVVTNATSSIAEGLKDKLSPPNQGKPKVVVPGAASKPVIIVEGARTDPIIIKPVAQLPINNTKAVPWNYKQVIVTYKGKEVEEEVNETRGLTRSGRCFSLEELRKAKPPKENPILVKKPVTKEEAEEFLRKMKVQDYSIVEQLRKTPAQISLLSLLMHSDEHHRALRKILNEAHVPDKITVNHLEKIANKIFEKNRITFSDDELPLEGTERNRALYLTVKCEHSVVTRVLVDNGSSTNICPLSTLHKFNIDTERIHMTVHVSEVSTEGENIPLAISCSN
ncbi:PREDICTED: uncharacterized protein LOC109227675 [Nicotiana attenuata]|uniref:uncharacterized protein LOC109227675 n=1 Tax=Nicotiana attenuata TaxID=49451 RepID=UPI0009052C26|nr:PREDICTED: uncharacterized protein LOC109227675 [Nicotiana attenuata]